MSSRVRAGRISLVPQRFRSDVPFRVRAVVSMGAPNASRSRLDDVLQQLHLDTLADRIFATLSTGQQQRVVIARAMIQRKAPGVIVLDEPLASLDLRHAGGVLAMLRGRAESGDRIIMSMHDLSTASMVADAIWLLKEGQLVAAGLPDQVLTAPQLEAVFETGFEAVPGPGGVSVLVPVFGVGFGDGAGASSVVDADTASG
jgi:iron complex transport system ATP-binding protein